ncbi:hypothetical protein D3C80_1820870 [compost metagenome]
MDDQLALGRSSTADDHVPASVREINQPLFRCVPSTRTSRCFQRVLFAGITGERDIVACFDIFDPGYTLRGFDIPVR